jgi:capsular exopolysaccharide synthesis family protein
VRETAGAPVLGAIPTIVTAYTAVDRGQIVHHDPFGDAAESYRTLRTALQFGLPQGTKTLLVTSPIAGDGKSTVVSNLAIVLAQAGKRVLVIDADFRAPMQHRLFNVSDLVGFASVLGGSDTIDQAVQHTSIANLDLLPCGPIPSNPAEMLNDPTFGEHLNDLADKYDLVLLDSPPVTAVADARILAASVDASMLVVRPQSSTRKQTQAARDGLGSVGARLIGVAVNAVQQGSAFGGASGYYPRTEGPLEFASRVSASNRIKKVPVR